MSINNEFARVFKQRTKNFALAVIEYCRKMPRSQETYIIKDQLIRCSTSIASNYRAACRSRSAREFYAKLCIVVEEADEAVFWLEIIKEAKISENDVDSLIQEGTEILYVSATARKTAGSKLS